MLQTCLRPPLAGKVQHHTVFAAHHAVVFKAMALEGRGIAWLPRSLVAAELAGGQLVAAGATNGRWRCRSACTANRWK